MPSAPVIVWFRSDLRLSDNPAWLAASQSGAPVIPLYILDDDHVEAWKIGAASRVWLHHSLSALHQSFENKMIFMRGSALDLLPRFIHDTGARAVYWNRLYEPYTIARDTKIKETVTKAGIAVHSFNANLLYEPWEVLKTDRTPYRVFTPFWRKGCVAKGPPPSPVIPDKQSAIRDLLANPQITANILQATTLDALNLLPTIPRWDISMIAHWQPGEAGAQARFQNFLDHGLRGYKEGRNRPDLNHTSRLSPHLHFGEISPRQLYHTARFMADADPSLEPDIDCFLSELGWREFSHHLLYHFPTLPSEPLQPAFKRFPWLDDAEALQRWQRGQTGFPIVDAGMRELWTTGYMHNRVRMIVGSFLVKNLLTPWQKGEAWFWDCLLDADLANNSASWQWIAGCGADAAPYFRIFNPKLQAEKFDPDGTYVRRFIPELGTPDYPPPILDHTAARDRALTAYARIKTT